MGGRLGGRVGGRVGGKEGRWGWEGVGDREGYKYQPVAPLCYCNDM